MVPRRLLLPLLLLAGPLAAQADTAARDDSPAGVKVALGPVLSLAHSATNSFHDAVGYFGTQWRGLTGRAAAQLGEIQLKVVPEIAVAGYVARPPTYRFDRQDALPYPDHGFALPAMDQERKSVGKLQVLRMDFSLRHAGASSLSPPPGWAVGLQGICRRANLAASVVELGATVYASREWGL